MEAARHFYFLLLILGLVSSVAFAPTSLAAQTLLYDAEELGALSGDDYATPSAINALGQVAGTSGMYPWRAFVYTDGIGMVELFPIGGRPYAIASGVSDLGVVVGESWGGGMLKRAVRWTAGSGEDLGALGTTSSASDVNIEGTVVGSTTFGSDPKAFSFTDAGGMELISEENFRSGASDINATGQVSGSMTVYNTYHAYRFTPGVGIEDLGVVNNFLLSFGSAINVSGQVAGHVTSATGNTQRVFRYTDGAGMVELGGLGETNLVSGMNARGDFVGRGRPAVGIERAFLYTDEGGLQDLELSVDWPTTDHYRLLYVMDINDAGQIVGLAYNHDDNNWHAMRLNLKTPVGPLAAMALAPVRIEGGETGTGWATLTRPAPAGGAVVALSSGDPGTVGVPASVEIPEGKRHGQFAVTTAPVVSETSVPVTADYDGGVRIANLEVTPSTPTGIRGGRGELPLVRVHDVRPNPSHGVAEFRYELSHSADVRLRVYDVAGRLVRGLVDWRQESGLHPVVWDGRNEAGAAVPSGTYFYRIEASGFRHTGKLVLVR